MRNAVTLSLALVLAALGTAPAAAQGCRNTADFGGWLNQFAAEALAAGISRRTVNAALSGVTFDQRVYSRDRRQSVFSQSFLEFAGRMVADYRLTQGRARLKKHAALFAQIEKATGVPGPVIAAFWGLETDYGANLGDFATIRALATLAYDCRRPEKFRPQLLAALEVVERGDLAPAQMHGAWAGELGQTQLLPSDYFDNGVDMDGDGRVDLLSSVPDVLASTAKVLAAYGWRRGEPWLEEVVVPDQMPWAEAGLTIYHTRADWAGWGVRRRGGGALPADGVPTALLLPMGRLGPAFLAYANFKVFLAWNASSVYSTTAAYFATRLAGAPPVSRGKGQIAALSFTQIKELQRRLMQAGYDTGGTDGIIGEQTRDAVRQVQLRLGLPADAYPTQELLARLK